jgi:hypothetical protein
MPIKQMVCRQLIVRNNEELHDNLNAKSAELTIALIYLSSAAVISSLLGK